MIQAATGIMIAYVITFFLLPFVIRIARQNKLYDIPDERKTHTDSISSLGGIGIFAGLLLSLLLVSDFKSIDSDFQYYLASFIIVFIIGLIDDLFVLKAWKKAFGQFAIAAILTFKAHLLVPDLHGFLGIYQLNAVSSHILSFFAIILIINSYNLIDGVDGLAASLGMMSCSLFGIYFLLNNNIAYALLGFCMSGALLAFLIYNFHPARIFMGDSGSTLIGLVNAVLIMKFVENPAPGQAIVIAASPAIGFGMLLIPLMDVLRVFVMRLYHGRSPFVPDRNHLHHLLVNKGYTHGSITLILLLSGIYFAGISYLLQDLNINLIVATQFCMFFGSVYLTKNFLPVYKSMHIVQNKEEEQDKETRIYPMYGAKEKVTVNED